MSNLMEHAKFELELSGYSADGDKDDMNTMMRENVLELIDVFSKQGHSGFSAPFCIGLFKELAGYKPLKPLTGEDDEWADPPLECSGISKQNIRCTRVFKDSDGCAYDSTGKIFRGPDGSCYTNKESRVNVVFPYTPKKEYVDVDEDGNVIGGTK